MTLPASELALPWSAFVWVSHPWHARLRVDGVEHTLSRAEMLRACAAAELDRVWPRDLRALLRARGRHRHRGEITWSRLMAGAVCTKGDAPGALSLGEVLEQVGAELIGFDLTVTINGKAAS